MANLDQVDEILQGLTFPKHGWFKNKWSGIKAQDLSDDEARMAMAACLSERELPNIQFVRQLIDDAYKLDMPSNPEDKEVWVQSGPLSERAFNGLYGIDGSTLQLPLMINPDKEHNKYVIDLMVAGKSGVYSDLKHSTTPLFTSTKFTGILSQFAFVINAYDIYKYAKLAEDNGWEVHIIFWHVFFDKAKLDKCTEKYYGDYILPMNLVTTITPQEILSWPYGDRPLRITDSRRKISKHDSNKPEGFVLDVRRCRTVYSNFCGSEKLKSMFEEEPVTMQPRKKRKGYVIPYTDDDLKKQVFKRYGM